MLIRTPVAFSPAPCRRMALRVRLGQVAAAVYPQVRSKRHQITGVKEASFNTFDGTCCTGNPEGTERHNSAQFGWR